MKTLYKIISCFIFCTVFGLKSQDLHFSQIQNNPLFVNPSLAGMSDADIRLSAAYRQQWTSVTTPYRTLAASIDAAAFKELLNGDFVGLGFWTGKDQAGDGNLSNTLVQFLAAYHKALNSSNNNFLSFGTQIGINNRKIDFSKLYFESQHTGDGFDSNIDAGENTLSNQFLYIDVSAGLSWNCKTDNGLGISVGLAAAHLNKPEISWKNADVFLFRKWSSHILLEIPLHNQFFIVPQIQYVLQGPHHQLYTGMGVQFLTRQDQPLEQQINLNAGMLYRLNDAMVPYLRIDLGAFSVGFSYDINISSLNIASNGRGGAELTMMYRHVLNSYNSVSCPRF